MKPYYSHNNIDIYLGDCQEILPSLDRPDLVMTDPPYGIDFQSRYRSTGEANKSGPRALSYKFLPIHGDKEYPKEMIDQLITLPRNACYICTRWDMFPQFPTPKSLIAWVKDDWSAGDLQHEHGRQWEAISFYPGPEHRFIKRIPDVIHAARTLNQHHPMEKPVELFRLLIGANYGDLIVDPYMGSGTVLRAAKDMGRRAIGIEIEEKYCEIAVKRLAQEVLI